MATNPAATALQADSVSVAVRRRFKFHRPDHRDGITFGFLYRFLIAVFSVIFGVALLFLAGFFSNWKLTSFMLDFFGFFISVNIFLGEHFRSRVFERVNSDVRPKGEYRGLDSKAKNQREHFSVDDDTSTKLEVKLEDRALEIAESVRPDQGLLLERAPLNVWERIVKRAFDVSLSLFFVVMLAPLFSVVIVAIKLDSRGPALIRQPRRRFDGREFAVYKFRTLSQHDDMQATRVGRLLQVTRLNELPQIINVLRGEMSLVGPRPSAVAHDDRYAISTGSCAFRYHIKPGMTGWAQIKSSCKDTGGRDMTKERIDLDIWYINNWSIWLDMWIIVRTLAALFVSR
jgi:lipopolysaccharide/colanic/teichoic acid biosynthesis glycosyltransferase